MIKNSVLIRAAAVFLFLALGCATERAPQTAQIPGTQPTVARARPDPLRFEKDIVAFEQEDQKTPPPQRPILFVGSSTIVKWKTSQAFPDLPVLNRGFGGSVTSDAVYYAPRIVLRYQPRMIVFYSGDNDLAGGMSPQDVADDTKAFIDLVRRELPQTRLVFIAIKPSVARWKLIDQVRQTNRQTKSLVQALPGSTFIDVESQILGADGKPQAELFQLDGLHLNAKGYEILNAAVRPYLTR